MFRLKKIISNSVFLYSLWFFLVRKRKGLPINFFSRDTSIYIDGYPRSGNTYIIHLVSNIWPDVNIVHHLHSVAPIKIALMLKLPIYIIIRDPIQAISSKYLKHFAMKGEKVNKDIDEKLLIGFVEDYINYYQFIFENINKISVVHFKELVTRPVITLKRIQEELHLKERNFLKLLQLANESYKGATDTMGSSLPNDEKEKYKKIVQKYIHEYPQYENALNLYKQIQLEL